MVHLRVGDADRAMQFFGALFGWQAERVPFDGHVSHYTINTTTTIRILDDPESPPVVPNYAVADVARARARGRWRRWTDHRGRARARRWRMGAWRRRPRSPAARVPPRRLPPARGTDASRHRASSGWCSSAPTRRRPRAFYGEVLGWTLTPAHPESHYFDAVAGVGVFDEAAAFGRPVEPSATLYFSVDALLPVLRQIEALGGSAGEHAQDMGPYFTARVHRRSGHDVRRHVGRARLTRAARSDRGQRRSAPIGAPGSGGMPWRNG